MTSPNENILRFTCQSENNTTANSQKDITTDALSRPSYSERSATSPSLSKTLQRTAADQQQKANVPATDRLQHRLANPSPQPQSSLSIEVITNKLHHCSLRKSITTLLDAVTKKLKKAVELVTVQLAAVWRHDVVVPSRRKSSALRKGPGKAAGHDSKDPMKTQCCRVGNKAAALFNVRTNLPKHQLRDSLERCNEPVPFTQQHNTVHLINLYQTPPTGHCQVHEENQRVGESSFSYPFQAHPVDADSLWLMPRRRPLDDDWHLPEIGMMKAVMASSLETACAVIARTGTRIGRWQCIA
ncbi:hypothetical protein BJ508DRAFT_334396 [Ascobolus immersus RN42]|uniref:Uncharacterized protein n=1 Tax=Ascobolus immersus RN42 TaxID=1160509 RepID=A0A3N4HKP4_ASCIM|nr:hypothetical protein BJ508DRAFT_334396 [Ascobolus immersus RN42]